MYSTIIQGWEVVKFGPVEPEYPTAYICKHIKRVEIRIFSKCFLGLKFYTILLNDLVDYSSATNYDINQTYAKNDLIKYDDRILQSNKNNNATHPDDSDFDWVIPDKFTSPAFQTLWEDHLRFVLSFGIIHQTLPYSTFKNSAKGLLRIKDDATGVETVGLKEYDQVKKEIFRDFEDQISIMYDWMLSATESGVYDFGMVKSISEACSSTEACKVPSVSRRRRFHFKN